MISCIISLIGTVLLIQYLRDVFYSLWVLFIAKPLDLGELYGKKSYAIITGGSKGIGIGFARELAKRNFNLVLISRNKDDLQSAKEDLQSLNKNVDVITRSFDFNTLAQAGVAADMWKTLNLSQENDYSILVNNVGIGANKCLNKLDEEKIKSLITVNCASQALMSHMMINYFKKRGKLSCIINTSSLANKFPFANIDLYGGTKAFNKYLAQCMLNNPKIDNYVYSPGMVDTDLTKNLPKVLNVSIDQSVGNAMKFVGRSRFEFHGHWKHECLHWFLKAVPDFLIPYIK